jgi:protein TonB
MLRYVLLTYWLLAGLAGPAHAQTAALSASLVPENSAAGAPASTAAAVPAAPTIYLAAEQMPAFPGGDAALLRFMASRLSYPSQALEHSISGKVHVSFTVDSEGRLRDPRVVKGLGYGLDEEAIRLLRLMPWWNPGRIQGQPVWVAVTMPIVFRAL